VGLASKVTWGYVIENPKTSVQQLALNHNMSRRSIQKIMKREKFHPFKIQLLHELAEDDFDRRTEFCEIMINKINQDDNFINHVLFSDESTFCLNGHVNRHNCRYWAYRNPHWTEEVHTQRPQKINVWCGIIGRNIIGYFFIDGNLTSAKYLQLLQQQVIPRLRQIFVNYEDTNITAKTVWFQQDGAPRHFELRQYLDVIF
jgi:hypothetical protein